MMGMLAGDLNLFPLPDVLRLLATTSKTGALDVLTDAGQGRIEVVEGRLRAATADRYRAGLARRLLGAGAVDAATLLELHEGATTLLTDRQLAERLVDDGHLGPDLVSEALREHTVDAVLELVRAAEGSFRFEGLEPPATDVAALAIQVDELLEEVERRHRAMDELETASLPPTAVVTVVVPDDEEVAVSADGWQLLGLIDGDRTVADLVELRGCGAYDTLRRLATLFQSGVVATVDRRGGTPVQRIVDGHESLSRLEARAASPAPAAPEPATPPVPAPFPPTDLPPTDLPDAAEPYTSKEEQGAEPADAVEPEAVPVSAATSMPGIAPVPPAHPERTEEQGAVAPLPDRHEDDEDDDPDLDEDALRRLMNGVETLR